MKISQYYCFYIVEQTNAALVSTQKTFTNPK